MKTVKTVLAIGQESDEPSRTVVAASHPHQQRGYSTLVIELIEWGLEAATIPSGLVCGARGSGNNKSREAREPRREKSSGDAKRSHALNCGLVDLSVFEALNQTRPVGYTGAEEEKLHKNTIFSLRESFSLSTRDSPVLCYLKFFPNLTCPSKAKRTRASAPAHAQ